MAFRCKDFEMSELKSVLRISFALSFLILACQQAANADNYSRHNDQQFGVEVNVLWLVHPFSTYEVKLWARIGDSMDAIVGFGDQAWTLDTGEMTHGHMNSQALILGVRGHLFRSGTVVELDNWIAHDHLTQKDGTVYEGYSISHELFGGYQAYLGAGHFSLTSGVNVGAWSAKTYTTPHDDRFIPTILPKISLGYDLSSR
jgi:hypothetical protein